MGGWVGKAVVGGCGWVGGWVWCAGAGAGVRVCVCVCVCVCAGLHMANDWHIRLHRRVAAALFSEHVCVCTHMTTFE